MIREGSINGLRTDITNENETQPNQNSTPIMGTSSNQATLRPGQIRGVFMREHITQTELQKQQEQKRLMKEMLE